MPRSISYTVITVIMVALACAAPSLAGKKAYTEEGLASWYGKKFQGKKTASGEKFDMHKLTAAHRTLPFGTRVKVTRIDNGKNVVVKINDRGPFVEGRIIDLSKAAAKKLDMINTGVARVRIKVVKSAQNKKSD